MMNIWAYLSLATGCLIVLVIFIDVLADVWYRYETDEMIKRCKRAFNHYDNFHLIIPTWYEQYKKGS